jgi:uncharacterized membrane protein
MDNRSINIITNKARSFNWVSLIIPLMGLIGMGISGYLTFIHYRDLNAVCLFGAKCDAVLTSAYSAVGGIPLSLFGIIIYLILSILGTLRFLNRNDRPDLLAIGIYSAALAGTLFSIYLYYLEIFKIHAFCTWCIGSSIIMVCVLVFSVLDLYSTGFDFKEFRRYLRARRKQFIQW